MSAPGEGTQSSSNDLPFRQGALDAAQIRAECPQFRILIIGKANAGKTTILRKVCNAKPDAKPIIYDAEGKEVRQDTTEVCHDNLCLGASNTILGIIFAVRQVPTKACLENLAGWPQIKAKLGVIVTVMVLAV